MSSSHPFPKPTLASFASLLARQGADAVCSPDTLVAASGADRVFYVPFEYVERRARLVLVGITPGPEQMKLSYAKAGELLGADLPPDEVLRLVKPHGAFGGPMRPNLLKMLHHFDFASLLGVRDVADLWDASSHLLHATSVVPHAAFVGAEMFNGSFDEVMRSPALRHCFEMCFLPELALLPEEAVFVALGPTPLAALDHAVVRGLLAPERILGSLAHPSKRGGSQVDVFLGLRTPDTLKPNDPVLRRVPRLLAQAERMRASLARLRGGAAVPMLAAPPPRAPAPVAAQPGTIRPATSAAPCAVAAKAPAPTTRTLAGTGNDDLHAFVPRGRNKGLRLTPHIYSDGCYVVSPTRFEVDQIRVPVDQPLEGYLRRGLRLRMSAPHHGLSLIKPESIHGRML